MKYLFSAKYFMYWGLLIVFLSAFNSIGFHQSDEHYQILEFAAMQAGKMPASELPWEYAEQMRPGLQPAMAYVVYRAIGDPFWTAWLLRLLSGGFTLLVAWMVYRSYSSTIKQPHLLTLFAGLCFLHWIMLYSGGRFASESWSGLTLALGFMLYPLQKHAPLNGSQGHEIHQKPAIRYLLVGLLFGLAFCFRYQVALAILGFGAWLVFVARERWWRLLLLILGGLAALGLGALTDYWLYGDWVNAPWNYLAQNLLEGKAAGFGTRPWWGYFELVFLRGIPPLSLLYLLAPLLFFWRFRKDPISWMWVPFLLVHSYLARKDIRFLWPLLPLMPVVIVWSLQWTRLRMGDFWTKRSWRVFLILCVVLNTGLLAVNSIRPMQVSVAAAHYIYDLPAGAITVVVPEGRPYNFFDLPAHFYRSPGLTLAETCPEEGRCLYLLRSKRPVSPAGARLVWSNKPDWLPGLGQKWYYIYDWD